VEALLEARKGKNLTKDAALDAVTGDVNMFGVMMVAMGDAGGMVSGSIHTTAATIRPAMQVLKTPNLVSSVFFMCLPDKVRLGLHRQGCGCVQSPVRTPGSKEQERACAGRACG
jgi:phosphotransacetylase